MYNPYWEDTMNVLTSKFIVFPSLQSSYTRIYYLSPIIAWASCGWQHLLNPLAKASLVFTTLLCYLRILVNGHDNFKMQTVLSISRIRLHIFKLGIAYTRFWKGLNKESMNQKIFTYRCLNGHSFASWKCEFQIKKISLAKVIRKSLKKG